MLLSPGLVESKMKNIPTRCPWSVVIIVVGFVTLPIPVVANLDDPLNKPAVWNLLKRDPTDPALWASYMGKPWVCMNYAEKQQVEQWREKMRKLSEEYLLSSGEKADQQAWKEESVAVEKELRNKSIEAAAAEQIALIKQYEKALLSQGSQSLDELKSNISSNFILIEDMYKERFTQAGGSYQYYKTVHPNDTYSKVKWIEEMGAQLNTLKKEKINGIKEELN